MSVILTKRRSGGSGSDSNLLILNEVVLGVKNNINNVFSTSYNYLSGSLLVYYNGQRLIYNEDYKEQSANTFELVYVKPYNVDSLVVDYQIGI